MAKKKRRTARRKPLPGWVWMTFGLAIGLVVAAAVYIRGQPLPAGSAAAVPAASNAQTAVSAPAARPPAARGAEAGDPDDMQFDFYELLPRFEVVVPEIETAVTPGPGATAIAVPGVYVLQAGSFQRLADADRRQASLALLGIESTIQVVTVGNDTYHRVRIGPMSDLTELSGIRRRLINAEIDTLLIKLPQ